MQELSARPAGANKFHAERHIICDGWSIGILVREVIAAFPQIPLLGFDIVREVSTGKFFVLEANAIGYVWNFDARIKASYGFSAEAQFDGLRKAAYILAEKTQQSAD